MARGERVPADGLAVAVGRAFPPAAKSAVGPLLGEQLLEAGHGLERLGAHRVRQGTGRTPDRVRGAVRALRLAGGLAHVAKWGLASHS